MKRSIFLLSLFGASILYAQENDTIQKEEIQLQEVSIVEKLPITVEKVTAKLLQKKNLGQDVPTLLNSATSVSITSDTGTGIGYSSIKIRGLNEQSINVTLNGIPLNNPESQGVFWVNMPDLASSTNAMTIQRGVGTSSNGMASFGASVNIESQNPSAIPFAEANVSFGSFNTQKYTFQAGTGRILNNKLSIDGRFSKLDSDGYVDRAWADLISYDVTALYELNDKTKFRFQNMFGKEQTYQAWSGVDAETLKKDRTYNYEGEMYDSEGNMLGYYNNHTDNYKQNHYFLSWLQDLGNQWKSNLTIHYTKGKGYYESYKNNRGLERYKLNHLTSEKRNLINREYLDNDFYGFNLEVENQKLNDFKVFFGLSANKYDGDHYGNVLWVDNTDWSDKNFKYYNNNAVKKQFAAYAKVLYQINKFDLFGDLQYRYVGYDAKYLPNGENDAEEFRPFTDTFNFVNPKAGVNFNINSTNTLYASYGISHREPLRIDYEGLNGKDKKPEEEFLQDYELGYKKSGRLSLSANLYYMAYKNQLVPTGEINDVGSRKRTNSGKSFRRGIELDANYKIIPNRLNIFGNITFSENKHENYTEEVWDENWNSSLKEYGKTKIALSPDVISAFGFEAIPFKNVLVNLTNKYVGEQYLSNTEPVDGKLDSYLVSDLLIRYSPKVKGIKNLEFSILINNLFDVEYESNGYYYEGGYYFPQAGINVLGGISIRL
ncbi:TonB-dependent receptor [Empedobacter stercoris]|uniref:TonB-dependent receptor n=1 Tax=Empedobacter TaxID=59734 RepID=UPI0021AE5F74|nr:MULTISPECIES: TonB-dependent receptor [Empedobacter]MDM1521712.1 TonB-dependent receptor [Empedobacter sp. 225-1]MDM1541915.1 TonB-dependent receptor [Empedobacter sp. 189-2]UWX66317.1 TonB-dependent receptor [Empedobacter stercoris]